MRIDALFMPQATENSRPVNLVAGFLCRLWDILFANQMNIDLLV
jgi:hypothetical protein